MWVGVLGPALVRPTGDDAPVALTAAKHRALIAALALQAGRPVAADVLVEALWGPDAPPSAQNSLHSYLSVVRRTLEPDLTARAPSQYLVSSDLGYELRVEPGQVDAHAFAATVSAVHAAMGALAADVAPLAADRTAAAEHLARLDEALALWRGEAYADVVDGDDVQAERVRLSELKLLAEEDRATLLVALGDDSVVGDLEALVSREPLRERLWVLLAVALARAGRQADALAALDRLRAVLDEELGLDPSAAVRDLQTAVLRQEIAPVEQARTLVENHPAPSATPYVTEIPEPEWPLVGRVPERAALAAALDAADRGVPTFVTLVGEPGAGKTRLALETARLARERGFPILLGRCSQEEDAPPLWPWTSALGQAYAGASDDHDVERFAIAEAIRQHLVALATEDTVLLILEDVHWADVSSLRVLRHLAAHLDTARLLVLITTRPDPTGPYADTAAALARAGATTIEVPGLSGDDARGVLGAITGAGVDPSVAEALHARTDGNAFFLVEYARLARDKTEDLATLLEATPRSIADVVQRRLRQLPPPAAEAVTAGAVIGREFDLDLLAAALEKDELAVLDLLEPALAVDLVSDLGADRFRFSHALVRDTAYDELTPSRRERMHARLAELVQSAPGAHRRVAEIARHWTAAGPRHVAKAWRAEMSAGNIAMRAHAAEDAVRHLAAALTLLEQDRTASPRDRYDVLVGYADACRWSARIEEQMASADEAILIAAELGEPHLVVLAAAIEHEGAVWPVRVYGDVEEPVVAAMRNALASLPPEDSEVRARLMLVLAGELYYSNLTAEIDALVDAGTAMARRLGDARLLVDVLQHAYIAGWRRETIRDRLAIAEEAAITATEAGLVRSALVSRLHAAAARCAIGDMDGLEAEVEAIILGARENRMWFVELVTLGLAMSWTILRGDQAGFEAHALRIWQLDELISLAHKIDAVAGVLLSAPLWGLSTPDMADVQDYLSKTHIPLGPAFTVLLSRSGLVDDARAAWPATGYTDVPEDWFTEAYLAMAAEVSALVGDAELAAHVYGRLADKQAGMIISGTGPAHGPGDAYLALAAKARGEDELAAEHADRAQDLIAAWRLPQVAVWFDDLRERYGLGTQRT